MADLSLLFQIDPELAFKASRAGRLLLVNTFKSHGMSAVQAEDAADAVITGLDLASGDWDTAAATAVLSQINVRLSEILDDAADGGFLAAQLNATGAVALSGQDDRTRLRWAMLALLVYVNVTPTWTISSDRNWSVSNTPLVQEIVNRVLDSVDRGIDAWRDVERERARRRVEMTRIDPGQGLVSTSPATWLGPEGAGMLAQIAGSRIALENGNFALPDRESAIRLRDRIFLQFNRLAADSPCSAELDAAWFREKGRTWSRHAPYSFDAGLMPFPHPGDPTRFVYRVSVRVQSPGAFLVRKWRMLHEGIRETFHGVVSIRAMSEMKALGRPPSRTRGRYGPGPIRHGHAIAVANGTPGTVTCAARTDDGRDYLLITAGHVVGRQDPGSVDAGALAWVPPPVDGAEPPIGHVLVAEMFSDPWPPDTGTIPAPGSRHDIGAVLLRDPTVLAQEQDRRSDGYLPIRPETGTIADRDLASGSAVVVKGQSATAASRGQARATDYLAVMTYPGTLRNVCAYGLIEIHLDGKTGAVPQESGTACYDENGRLLGLIVGGSGRMWDAEMKNWNPVVYVQPVHDFFQARGWKVF